MIKAICGARCRGSAHCSFLSENPITSFLGIDGGLFVNKCHIFNGVRFEETPSANYRKTRDSMLSFKRHDNFVPSGSSTRLFSVHHWV